MYCEYCERTWFEEVVLLSCVLYVVIDLARYLF
jgi:hypothetical protein